MDGYLNFEELNIALDPMPPELKAYDTDNDGRFTLNELEPAFNLPPVPPPTEASESGELTDSQRSTCQSRKINERPFFFKFFHHFFHTLHGSASFIFASHSHKQM